MKRFLISRSWATNLLFMLMIASFTFLPKVLRPFLLECNTYQLLVASQVLVWLPVLLLFPWIGSKNIRAVSFRPLPIATIPLLILLAYGLLPLSACLNLLTQALGLGENAVSGITATLGEQIWVNLLFVAAMPAISEELLCRGVLFGGYRPFGFWGAVGLSAFCFGILHMNINQFSYAFVIGIAFAIANEASGSIFAGMVMHFTFNANSVLILALLNYLQKTWPQLSKALGLEIFSGSMGLLYGSGISQIGKMDMLLAVVILLVYSMLPLFMSYLLLICIAKIAKREAHMQELFGKYWLGTKKAGLPMPEASDMQKLSDTKTRQRKPRYIDMILILTVVFAFRIMMRNL